MREKESKYLEPNNHMGSKVGGARRLVGITQKELADRLGVTKQAVSKLEQTENIDDERLGKVAIALGVSIEGLKNFNTESVLYYTNNFYENCGVTALNGGMIATGRVEHIQQFSIKQAIELFEELLKMEGQQFQKIKKNDSDKTTQSSGSKGKDKE